MLTKIILLCKISQMKIFLSFTITELAFKKKKTKTFLLFGQRLRNELHVSGPLAMKHAALNNNLHLSCQSMLYENIDDIYDNI